MEIYSEIILKHNNAPFHFEKRNDTQHVLEAYNPLCGDKFKIYLDIDDGVISKIYFHGYGCAVSKAATSVLMKKIFEKNIPEAKKIIENYFQVLEKDFEKNISKNIFENIFEKKNFEKINENIFEKKIFEKNNFFDEEIFAFNAVKDFPERKTCATLSWEVLKIFLNQNFQN